MTLPIAETLPLSQPDDPYLPIIRQVFRVEDVTWGTERQNYLVRYRGHLVIDSEAAYTKLSASLKSLDVTPLFRTEGGQQIIFLLKGTVRPRPSNPWINLILFILTGVSVIFAGTVFEYAGPISSNLRMMIPYLIPALIRGAYFAISLLAILLAHEFGHYLAARYHRSAVTLPYFIPFPLSPFGTMGAFIQLKEPPRNKRILLDIGLAGPLAGLVVAIPIVLLGLYLSDLGPLPSSVPAGQALPLEGNSIFYLFTKYLVFNRWLPEPASYGGVNPLIYWIRYVFTSRPLPLGGQDVLLHPVAWAGWSGLFVTALNLIPAGQLDGGHALYVLLGRRARAVLPFILVGLIALGFVWSGWWLWAALIFILGRVFAEPLDQITPLDPKRKILAVVGLLLFFLLFTPIPLPSL
jgi:membrane-associated protease RseP (regulator of RpoE activity)